MCHEKGINNVYNGITVWNVAYVFRKHQQFIQQELYNNVTAVKLPEVVISPLLPIQCGVSGSKIPYYVSKTTYDYDTVNFAQDNWLISAV